MTVTIHNSVLQGSEEWLELRRGLLTASEMKLILTPTLKVAANDKQRAHVYEILAQRISGYVEPHYVSDDMLRGIEDEAAARKLYSQRYAKAEEVGFITNDKWGFTLGYSPDGIVGDDGLIECKSRRQKYQIQTICEYAKNATVPADYVLQCQAGLLISERKWIDLISYSGGLPMLVMRIHPDKAVQEAIVEAATAFEAAIAENLAQYNELAPHLPLTERTNAMEMIL